MKNKCFVLCVNDMCNNLLLKDYLKLKNKLSGLNLTHIYIEKNDIISNLIFKDFNIFTYELNFFGSVFSLEEKIKVDNSEVYLSNFLKDFNYVILYGIDINFLINFNIFLLKNKINLKVEYLMTDDSNL